MIRDMKRAFNHYYPLEKNKNITTDEKFLLTEE
jgi:hypothetical protein